MGSQFMHPYHRIETFNRAALMTYFILPDYTQKGIGKEILDYFVAQAKTRDIDCLLANISSLNQSSIQVHAKNGFVECGWFRRIGRKRGKDFDVIWMQRLL